MKWISRLRASFGAPFLFLISSIYWTQGFRSLPWMAISYQLKDELRLSPSASQFVMTVAFMPWSIKPLYGILSDCVPIKGSRRVSYLMISGILSYIPWLLLGLYESIRMSTVYLTGLLLLQNLGSAMADVVIDAMIAEAARKERTEFAGDLQSMSWFAMALGGMFGSVVGGFALLATDVKGIFLAFSSFPLLQLVSCGLVDEKALINEVSEVDNERKLAEERNQEREFDFREKLDDKDECEPIADEVSQTSGLYRDELDDKDECEPIADEVSKTSGLYRDELDDKDECEPIVEDRSQTSGGSFEKDVAESDNGMEEFTYGMLIQEDGEWVEVQANNTKEDLASDESDLHQDKMEANASALVDERMRFNDSSLLPGEAVASEEFEDKANTPALVNRNLHFSDSSSQAEAQPPLWSSIVEQRESSSANSTLSITSRLKGTFQILLQTIKQPAIRWPMLWFFLAQVSVPSLSTIMFYYQTNHLLLDASFLGTSRLVGWGALMLGTFIYNQYLKSVELRRIFWWTHIALALITLVDVLLVSGVSNLLAIPNKVFIVGASALGDAVNQFKFMPFLVLSGRLCQPGIEGTLFALFMSLNNLGSTLSSFFGAGLASALHISSDHFENFSIGICIQALCTIFPIFFLHWIPEGTGVDVNKLD